MRTAVAFVGVLGFLHADAYSYSGKLSHSKHRVGPVTQIQAVLGTTPKSCSISWVSQLEATPETVTYYPSYRPRDNAIASAYFAVAEYGATPDGSDWERQLGYATVYTEARCGESRLLSSVFIPDCTPGETLYYRLRNEEQQNVTADGVVAVNVGVNEWSRSESLRLPRQSAPQTRIAMLADINHRNPNPFIRVGEMAREESIDLALVAGDLAYDLDHDCGESGDEYIEFVAQAFGSTKVPVVFGVGDHEGGRKDIFGDGRYLLGRDYEAYRARFGDATWGGQSKMAHASGSPTPFYLSFDVNQVHFAIINSNAWVKAEQYWMMAPQYAWLDRDLANVDRTKTPWVVVITHRAPYCHKNDDNECNSEAQSIRYGVPGEAYDNNIGVALFDGPIRDNDNRFSLEDLFRVHNVDMVFSGHTHHYERSFPVYDETVQAGVEDVNTLRDPEAPFYIVGADVSAGEDRFAIPQPEWSANRDEDMTPQGWGHLVVNSATHMRYTHYGQGDEVIDYVDVHRSSAPQGRTRVGAAPIVDTMGRSLMNRGDSEVLFASK